MSKVSNINDKKYIKLVEALPKIYSITIIRKASNIDAGSEAWDEEFEWKISDSILDSELGDKVIFNHLLSMVDYLQQEYPDLKEELKNYISQELYGEITNDRNFNI